MSKSSKSNYKSRTVDLEKRPERSSDGRTSNSMAPPPSSGAMDPRLLSAVLPRIENTMVIDDGRNMNYAETPMTMCVGEDESSYKYSKPPGSLAQGSVPSYPSNPSKAPTVHAPAYQSHYALSNPQAVHQEYQYQSYMPEADHQHVQHQAPPQYGHNATPQPQHAQGQKYHACVDNPYYKDSKFSKNQSKPSKSSKKKKKASSSSSSSEYTYSSFSSSFEEFAEQNQQQMAGNQLLAEQKHSKRPLKAMRQVYKENKVKLAGEYQRWTQGMPFDDRTVIINVYHLSSGLKNVNKIGNMFNMNMGLYHASVEIGGLEWAYGGTAESRCGIYKEKSRSSDQFEFDEAIYVGQLLPRQSQRDIKELERSMRPDWNGIDYDLTGKNCISFVHAFIEKLGFEPQRIPSRLRVLMEIEQEVGVGQKIGSGVDKIANFIGNMFD